MKTRKTKAKNIQVGDKLVRENLLNEKYSVEVTGIYAGEYMSIQYMDNEGCEFVTHHFHDEIIEIEDNTE